MLGILERIAIQVLYKHFRGGSEAMLILLIQGGLEGPELGKTCLYNTCTLPKTSLENCFPVTLDSPRQQLDSARIWDQKLFWTKNISGPKLTCSIFLEQKFLKPKYFFTRKFLWHQISFDPKLLWPQNSLDLNLFQTTNILGPKILLVLKKMCTPNLFV